MNPENSTAARPGDPPAAVTISRRQVLQTVSGLVVGLFVAILAGTVVSTTLPRITADLGADQSAYAWVITAELLAMTATVPPWGKLSDLFDKKLLVRLSLVLYIVGSLLAGFSQGVGLLILSRVVQGVGAGGLTALTRVVMAAVIPPRQLGRYNGIFGAVLSGATVAGPLIGGVLVDTSWLGWRWCFFIGVPCTLLAIVLLQRTLDLPTSRREVRIDSLGAFLIVSGVSVLLLWVPTAGGRFGWLSWQSAALVGGGTLLLGAALRVETRAAEPIVPLRVFRNRTVALTTLASLLVGVALSGGTVGTSVLGALLAHRVASELATGQVRRRLRRRGRARYDRAARARSRTRGTRLRRGHRRPLPLGPLRPAGAGRRPVHPGGRSRPPPARSGWRRRKSGQRKRGERRKRGRRQRARRRGVERGAARRCSLHGAGWCEEPVEFTCTSIRPRAGPRGHLLPIWHLLYRGEQGSRG